MPSPGVERLGCSTSQRSDRCPTTTVFAQVFIAAGTTDPNGGSVAPTAAQWSDGSYVWHPAYETVVDPSQPFPSLRSDYELPGSFMLGSATSSSLPQATSISDGASWESISRSRSATASSSLRFR